MRADRLLAMLLWLQNRGRTTAKILADELEVSVRTIYRDIDALCAAGVPLYTDRGPGGGIALFDSYRTNLTGLTEDEKRALFLLSIPTPFAQLGLSQQIKSALLKLQAAVPAEESGMGNGIHQRLHLDWVGWHRMEEHVPHLRSIQQAVWQDWMLDIQYRSIIRDQVVDHVIAPYSLVAKAGTWYLVALSANRKKVYQVSRVVGVKQLSKKFERPSNYDLSAFWQNWCKRYEEHQTLFRVLARININLLPYLTYIFCDQFKESFEKILPVNNSNWITVELSFESFEAARGKILSCGCAIEVLEPQALRISVVDYAEQIISFYSNRPNLYRDYRLTTT